MSKDKALIEFFRSVRPSWENSMDWAEDDSNFNAIERRREALEDMAIDSGKFEDMVHMYSWEEISDAALDYIVE